MSNLKLLAEVIKKKKENKKNLKLSQEDLEFLTKEVSDKINESPANVTVTNLEKFPHEIDIKNIEKIGESIPTSFDISDKSAKKIGGSVKFPSKFSLSGTDDLAKKLAKYFPKTFKISVPKQDIPESVKKLSFAKTETILGKIAKSIESLTKIFKKGIYITNKEPKDAIPVRITDKQGKDFVDQLKYIIGGGSSSTSGTGYEVVGVKNATDERVNPATEAKQDQMIAAVQSNSSTPKYGFVKKEITETYKYILWSAHNVGIKVSRKNLSTGETKVSYSTATSDTDINTVWGDKATLTYTLS